jgi:hypothetical protein
MDIENNTEPIEQPHDKGYKRIFLKKRNFIYFLKKYIQVDWIDNIDENDLVPIKTEHIGADFTQTESDVIYRLKLQDKEIIFYTLLELQSSVGYSMPFRLLKYIVAILNWVFEDIPKNIRESANYKLPAIIPIIMYNGANRWTAAKSFKEYSEGFESFGEYLVDFKYLLFDLNRRDAETLKAANELLDIVFRLDSTKGRGDMINAAVSASEKSMHMSHDDKEDLYDWIEHIWLNYITDASKKAEILDNFKKGDVEGMNSGLGFLMEQERAEAKKEERLNRAKNLLDILDMKIIKERFELTDEEVKILFAELKKIDKQ